MPIEIEQFICRSDNYGVVMRETATGEVALIDAPEEQAILAAIERTGWTPSLLLITHHHTDHVEANLALKQRFGLRIVGPEAEQAKIPGIDKAVGEGSKLSLGAEPIEVLFTPGHTAGHISYHIPRAATAFTADTLFALGCGRLLECGPDVMFGSLQKLAALPPETVVYCGHEYTGTNARFALKVDPENQALRQRTELIERTLAAGGMTLPTTIGEELATNPFLRWGDPAIRRTLGMEDAPDAAVFAEIRRRKDNF